MFRQTASFLTTGIRESLSIYWTLLKIIVPVMIIVRIGIGFGLHIELAKWMGPVTDVLGLPAQSGLVLVTTFIAGFYGGAAVMVAMLSELNMTVAQATVLTAIMVAAHSLPMEQQIVRQAGVRIVPATLLRIGVALGLGWLLHLGYSAFGVLEETLVVGWAPDTRIDAPWPVWAQDSLQSLASIFGIIVVLIFALRLMDVTGATRWVTRGLSPFLTVMGISKDATTVTMTGVLLGLGFGGALIIREAKTGRLGPRTLFLSLVFMSMCHGLIEDTLFALLLGGHISGVFFGRVLSAVAVTMLLNRLIRTLPDDVFFKYLFVRPRVPDARV